jgi:hypothetical protein
MKRYVSVPVTTSDLLLERYSAPWASDGLVLQLVIWQLEIVQQFIPAFVDLFEHGIPPLPQVLVEAWGILGLHTSLLLSDSPGRVPVRSGKTHPFRSCRFIELLLTQTKAELMGVLLSPPSLSDTLWRLYLAELDVSEFERKPPHPEDDSEVLSYISYCEGLVSKPGPPARPTKDQIIDVLFLYNGLSSRDCPASLFEARMEACSKIPGFLLMKIE